MEERIIPGRECGSCNVCCVSLTIDDPELQKLQGYRCKNAQPDNSCAIYESRPSTCRKFNCGWRMLKFIKLNLRPDQSGVLIRLHYQASGDDEGRLGVSFMLLSKRALKAEGLAESIAAAIASGVPVNLQVPGPPGYTGGNAPINDALLHAVQTRDKNAVLAVLHAAYRQGRAGKFVPIKLKNRSGDATPAA